MAETGRQAGVDGRALSVTPRSWNWRLTAKGGGILRAGGSADCGGREQEANEENRQKAEEYGPRHWPWDTGAARPGTSDLLTVDGGWGWGVDLTPGSPAWAMARMWVHGRYWSRCGRTRTLSVRQTGFEMLE